MRVVSGIQTTGNLHLGNYLGAIRQWVDMQDQGECLFFLADLHALTGNVSPQELANSTIEMAATTTVLASHRRICDSANSAW